MLSIETENIYEYTIKKSKFIALIFPINNKDEITKYLNKTKQNYPSATHYCYGYILDNEEKSSDDKEPSGVSIPILNNLKSNNLNHTLLIVVRYFGGTKLGIPLLTKTYSNVAKEVINKSNIIEITKGYNIEITFPYEEVKKIDYLLKDSQIIDKQYNEKITYIANINKEVLSTLTNYNIKINKEIYIKK